MALVRWEPVRERSSLQNDMNRLFNTFFNTTTGANGATPRRWVPAMDLVETDDHFVLKADLPGLSEEDVHVDVDNDVLTVSGERKSEHEDKRDGFVRVERSYGSFRR
jgi:HSP20 family protein